MKLERRKRPDFDVPGEFVTFYVHPNGWRIKAEERDWDARPFGAVQPGYAGPKRYWVVKARHTRGGRERTFDTLREARVWCDKNTPATMDRQRRAR